MELFAFLVILVVVLGTGLLVQWLPMRHQPRPSWAQRAPFLGGGTPDNHAWSRYHVRYYSMTLLLIAFEMEMMFMYPWAVVFVEKGMKAMMEMGMFLAILSVGIVYAWREGVFKWQ
ncbi:NADH-quinone oxidoreductase subunit A [Chromohalobacter israelensis]|uniref:NADH-quinone oxidoreductase subunit A n=1 Tax=Chromohalobacter israelensis TaxID=141390 RepID=UPI000FFED7BE|nr:NADH-quinone oxidoreductase subunit A [Chromohalobacter salexigens]RXE49065.1 NADH-quinone oxidoreductase subunit A [Chromohalobacter salexigens]